MRRATVYLLSLALVACTGEADPEGLLANDMPVRDSTNGEIKEKSELPNPPSPPPLVASAVPGLVPLSDAIIRKELGSAAGCALVERGIPLVAATVRDALVNDGGRVVHLKTNPKDWRSLVRGGRFVGKGLVVEITSGPVRARRAEQTELDTEVTITRGNKGFKTFHGPPWVCGSLP